LQWNYSVIGLGMFNKETEYALRGLVYIQIQNARGRKPGIAEIAKEIETPQFYMAKILQRLAKQGLVQSAKGKGGGFYFDKDKPDLPLKEVIQFTEGTEFFNSCAFGLKKCSDDNPCPMHERYALIRESISQMVTQESIQSFANKILNGHASINGLANIL
jgi:Rrf2 family protein